MKLHLALPCILCFSMLACNSPKHPEKQPGDKDKQISIGTDGAAPGAADTKAPSATVAGDQPADLADIERYYDVMHMREQVKQLTEIMSHQASQMMHEALNEQPNLPQTAKDRFNALYERILKNMPTEELLQAMAPIYAKHFTKSDINAIITFYSSPVGKKMIDETPEITQEAMQASVGVMQKYMTQSMEEINTLVNTFQSEAAEEPKETEQTQETEQTREQELIEHR